MGNVKRCAIVVPLARAGNRAADDSHGAAVAMRGLRPGCGHRRPACREDLAAREFLHLISRLFIKVYKRGAGFVKNEPVSIGP